MSKLDSTLDKLYNCIKDYFEKNNYQPTIRELCDMMGVRSPSTVFYYLEKLEAQGKIKKSNNKSRAIELVEYDTKSNKTTKIPLIGNVAAGTPILAFENYEDVYELSSNIFSNNDLFMLNIQGDSMINAGIYNGDKVVVKQQQTADNGDIVVAMINGSATVKRYFKEENIIRLQPENDSLEPIYSKEVTILGKVVGLIRTKI